MNKCFCIYVFSDEGGVPKYVGKAKNFSTRINQHLNRDRFKYNHTYFYRWLNKQIAEDKEFFIDILEECNQENWKEREKYWIAHIKENNFPLTNMTEGGDGNNNQVFSRESIIKRSNSLKGHIVTQETRNKISVSHTGKKLSKETKQKLSDVNKGKSCPEYLKDQLSKKVEQYSLEGTLVQEFKSLTLAAQFLDCRKSSLANAISRKKIGKFKNYIWKYK